jgi:NADPH-dependent curcumin reductase CurA
MATKATNRQIHLASRPHGWPTAENFALVEAAVPEPRDGQVLVRNRFMSVDPAMRGRMNDVKSYVPPFEVGKAMDGGAVGEVVESRSDRVKAGDTVLHSKGWRDYVALDADRVRVVDPAAAPVTAYLGVLGMTGLTAYAGLTEIAQLKAGETVFVSGAAGAVGSVAGQLAKLLGAGRVIGSAGSAEKVEWIRTLGFDAAFNYKDAPVREQLKQAAPDGIDVYFDNVGGDHLEAAIASLNLHGRAAICGMISQYNATEPTPAPRNLALTIGKRLTLRGFLVLDHGDLFGEYVRRAAGWLAEGKLTARETVVEGLEHAPDAFLGMLRGDNTGKMLVKIS